MAANPSQPAELTDEQRERKELIVRNLQEVLGEDRLCKHLISGKNIHVYWGTATTGRPHVGYFVPMQKIGDYLKAGIKVTVLFADLHGFLDNLKSSFELLENRVKYYEHVIKALLSAFDVPLDLLHFVKGSTYQLKEDYTQDVLRLCGQVSERDALRAGAEVVKQVASPLLSGLMYPLLQALDEQYLKVDGQFGGVDQRKIFILAEEQLPKLKLGKRYHFMNPMIPGLTGTKMSSSEENTKIDLLDSPEDVERKILNAYCPKSSEDGENGVLAFYQYVVLPAQRPVVFGDVSVETAEQLKEAFESGKVSEQALKETLVVFLNRILGKVRSACDSEEIRELITKGYIPVDGGVDEKYVEVIPSLSKNAEALLAKIANGTHVTPSKKLYDRLNEEKPVRVLWRVGAKGRIHLGYVKALLELKRLQSLGCQVTILISGLAGFLDNERCPWNARDGRCTYYEVFLRQLIKDVGLQNVEIKKSAEQEFKHEYTIDMYKTVSHITRDESAILSGNSLAVHLYPIYQFLDAHYADADLILIGEHEENYTKLAGKISQRLEMPHQTFLFHKCLKGMDGNRMSSAQEDFHLNPVDKPKQLKTKIGKSFCEPGNLEGNIAFHLVEELIVPLSGSQSLEIERAPDNGGNLSVANTSELRKIFEDQKLHPADLKAFVIAKLNTFLQDIRTELDVQKPEVLKIDKAAFPPLPKGGKKK